MTNIWKKIIPMQYTGLKDKNGKEIYEGDVVVASGGRNKAIVEYKIYGYKPFMPGWGDWEDSFSDIEIIGNIYENPELLPTNKE